MTSLYDINNEINKVIGSATVNEGTGEIVIDIELLEKLSMDKDEKMQNIIGYYKNLLSDSDQLKLEAEKFVYKSKVIANKAEALKRYLVGNLAVGEKRTFGFHAIGWRKSKSLFIDDNVLTSDLEEEYVNTTTTVAFDKTKITNAIKAGDKFVGISLVEKQSISIK